MTRTSGKVQVEIDRRLADRVIAEAQRRVIGRGLIIDAALNAWLDAHEEDEIPQ